MVKVVNGYYNGMRRAILYFLKTYFWRN